MFEWIVHEEVRIQLGVKEMVSKEKALKCRLMGSWG